MAIQGSTQRASGSREWWAAPRAALCFAFVAYLVLSGPANADEEMTSPMTADELIARIDAGTAPTIVDVRSRSEYEEGHVPGAIHIPFWAALGRTSEIPSAPSEPVVIYCEHGPRAVMAKSGLFIAGYAKVILLKEHMTGWKKRGLRQESGAPEAGGSPGSEGPG